MNKEAKLSSSITIGGYKKKTIQHGESSSTVKGQSLSLEKSSYSHFISLPLAMHPELVAELENFKTDILRAGNWSLEEMRIDRTIFNNPKTFHLTVLMLKLLTKEKVAMAKDVLKDVHPEVLNALGNMPIYIRLSGLKCIKGTEAKARVVYAKIEEVGGGDRLLRACNVIRNAYKQAGLVIEDDISKDLMLHATVMNVSYRKGKPKRRDDYFDARGIFEKFGTKNWGTYWIREAHLSQRFVYDENGYYHCCASILFP